MASIPLLTVHKFGGASLANAEAIVSAARLLASHESGSKIVVTSALRDVTNALIGMIQVARRDGAETAESEVGAMRERHLAVVASLALTDTHDASQTIERHMESLRDELRIVAHEQAIASALSDEILAHGERLAAAIFASVLRSLDVNAQVVDGTELIVTDNRHGDGAADFARTDARASVKLEPLIAAGIVPVVPGFIGAAPDGSVVTLGRGGSDLTATLLARAMSATDVVLWKDVPGCMTADPRIVSDARVVPMLDAREASELAYYGAKVLHPRTLLPLERGTSLHLRPFGSPRDKGTTIVAGKSSRGAPVRAISAMSDQAMVAVNGTGMLGIPGVAARVFGTLAREHVSVSLISQSSSEQSICFTVPGAYADRVCDWLRLEFAEELHRGEIDDVSVTAALSTIAVVGSGMAHSPGISSRIFEAVARAQVNVIAIAQGSSERNISFVVEQRDGPTAVRAVHLAFHLGKVGGGRAVSRSEPRDVILLGMGRVARELIRQITPVLGRRAAPIRIVGLIDSNGFVFQQRGFSVRQLETLVVQKSQGASLDVAPTGRAGDARSALDLMTQHALSRPILVDVASGDTGDALLDALRHNADLVLANKAPLASQLARARAILADARGNGRRVLHEATVGAGLPVIDTLQQLHASGDRVDSVESSPSGTMGFLFSEMGRGRSFSSVVLDAMERGYTEPDPRDDLCGVDVGRKGLILARILGYTGEMSDVNIESLVPEDLQSVSREAFVAALPECDAIWADRIAEAKAGGMVLRYRARATRGGVRVGLVSAPIGSTLASLDGTDNLFVFTTARYRNRPLVVSGPGAGVEVTAAGVLGDILRLTAK